MHVLLVYLYSACTQYYLPVYMIDSSCIYYIHKEGNHKFSVEYIRLLIVMHVP